MEADLTSGSLRVRDIKAVRRIYIHVGLSGIPSGIPGSSAPSALASPSVPSLPCARRDPAPPQPPNLSLAAPFPLTPFPSCVQVTMGARTKAIATAAQRRDWSCFVIQTKQGAALDFSIADVLECEHVVCGLRDLIGDSQTRADFLWKRTSLVVTDGEASQSFDALLKSLAGSIPNLPPTAPTAPTGHCSFTHSVLPAAHCPLPTVHCPLLAAHCPLLTTHYLLLAGSIRAKRM